MRITVHLERYRVVRRPPFKSGATVHVEQADPCGQCSSWSMLIRVASAALGACRSAWPVQRLGHADLCGQCSSWSMPLCVASAAVGACRPLWPVQQLEHVQHSPSGIAPAA